MSAWICRRCGVQYADTDLPPVGCAICTDEREQVAPDGQSWTTIEDLVAAGHRLRLTPLEPGMSALTVEPAFAIGQRALLVRTPAGNLLWDPPAALDAAAVAQVRALGGIAAIAASHPHFYGAQVEWSAAFEHAPILIPEADQGWVMRPDAAMKTWSGRHQVLPGLTLVECGGHFPGSAVALWEQGCEGRGALLVGGTIGVLADRRGVSFMYSYPNYLPLSAREVERMMIVLNGLEYERVHGDFESIDRNGRDAVRRSAQRYLACLRGEAVPARRPPRGDRCG